MTREEKQKAIDALKKSAPVMAMTQEEFNDYIQTLNKVIDWLEQEPTAKNDLGVDCISRTQAIERLKLNFPISQGADNSRDRHRYMQAQADLQAIRELPSVTPQEPKWIPVSERLPEDHKEVLVYLSSNRMTLSVYNSHILPTSKEPIGWGYIPLNGKIDFSNETVIAWMPLPEPYKGEL